MASARDQPPSDDHGRPNDAHTWVIVNPMAGGGISQKKWARLAGALSAGLGPFEVRFTDARGHATEIAQEIALRGRQLVVAFGGDGTISEVAAGLLAAHAAGAAPSELGIIPRGTGGDYRRSLELPQDVAQAAEHIRKTRARLVDAGRITFTTAQGGTATRTFVNVGSFGFSSVVAEQANLSSKALGAKAAFVGATVRTLLTYQNTEVFLELDDAPPVRRTLLFAAIGNGRYFGGGMKICPDSVLDDGLLSLVTIGDLGKLKVLANLPRIFTGDHLSIKDIHATNIRKLRASAVDPDLVVPVEMDGETPGRLPATFEVLPRTLLVRF